MVVTYRAELTTLLIRHARAYRRALRDNYDALAARELAVMRKLMLQIDERGA